MLFPKRLLIGATAACAALFASTLASPPPVSAQLPDLVVDAVILGNPPTVSPGEEFSYAMVITNQGGDMPDGSTSKVTNQLPPKVTFDFAEEGARTIQPFFLGVTCTFSAPIVTCEGPPLVAGDFYVVRIVADVDADASGGALVDHAFVDPLNDVDEANEGNNKDKVKAKIQ